MNDFLVPPAYMSNPIISGQTLPQDLAAGQAQINAMAATAQDTARANAQAAATLQAIAAASAEATRLDLAAQAARLAAVRIAPVIGSTYYPDGNAPGTTKSLSPEGREDPFLNASPEINLLPSNSEHLPQPSFDIPAPPPTTDVPHPEPQTIVDTPVVSANLYTAPIQFAITDPLTVPDHIPIALPTEYSPVSAAPTPPDPVMIVETNPMHMSRPGGVTLLNVIKDTLSIPNDVYVPPKLGAGIVTTFEPNSGMTSVEMLDNYTGAPQGSFLNYMYATKSAAAIGLTFLRVPLTANYVSSGYGLGGPFPRAAANGVAAATVIDNINSIGIVARDLANQSGIGPAQQPAIGAATLIRMGMDTAKGAPLPEGSLFGVDEIPFPEPMMILHETAESPGTFSAITPDQAMGMIAALQPRTNIGSE